MTITLSGKNENEVDITASAPLDLTNNTLSLNPFSSINILDPNLSNHVITVNTTNDLLLDGSIIGSGGGGGGGGSLSFTLPLEENNNIVSTLFKPSTVTSSNNSLQLTANDSTGALNIAVNPTLELINLQFNNQGTIKNLTTSNNNLVFDGHDVTTNTYLNTQLSTKQDNITFQVNGSSLSNVQTIDFLYNNANFTNNTLTLSRLTQYDKIPLIYSGVASIKDLYQGASGRLMFGVSGGTVESVAYLSDIPTSSPLSASLPLQINNNIISTLFKPSTITAGAGITTTANDSTGTLNLSLDGTESRTALRLEDSGGTVRNLTASITGNILYNGSTLVDLTYLNNQLGNKQDTISATAPLNINNNVLTTFFKPSTVSVGAGITKTANDATGTLTLTLDGTESRTALKLEDSGGTVRDLTASVTGAILYNGSVLTDLTYVQNQLSTKQDTISATLPLQISNNVISSLWKPSQTTTGAGSGLSHLASDTLGTLLLQCTGDEERAQVKLRSPNTTITEITADNSLNLLWGGSSLALQSWVTSQLVSNYQPKIRFYWTVAPTGNISGQFVDEIYYDTGLNVNYTLNTQTNKNELHIQAEVTQAELNAKQDDLNLTLTNGAINPEKIHMNITNGNAKLHLLGDNTVSTDILQRIELGIGQGDIFTVKKFANVGYIGIREYNPSEALEVNGNIRIQNNKLMIMNPTAEAIQSQGNIKLESGAGIEAFSDMQSTENSKFTCGNILSSDNKHYNKIALYEEVGSIKNKYFRGFGFYEYSAGSWGVSIYDNTLNALPKLHQGQTTGYADPRFYVTSSGVVTNGTCTASSFPTSSDERLKDNVSIVSPDVCESIFNSIDVKEYNRNDLENEPFRLGFIAQDVESSISGQNWTNIVHEINKDDEIYKGIDYSRMVCVLWGYCKKLESRVQQLETQIINNS